MPLPLLPTSQYIGRIVETFVFDHKYDTILGRSMVCEGFYDVDDEILRNAIVLTANEPKFKGK